MDIKQPLHSTVTTQVLPGRLTESYPVDWAGVWSGTLKIWTVQFDQRRWTFDATEASQEAELLKPGKEGQVSFNFSSGGSRRIQLEPTQVIFTAPMDESRYRQSMQQMQQQMQQMMPGLQESFGNALNSDMGMQMMKTIPYMYALHLGNLTHGTGVTGNRLESQVLSNNIKILPSGALEQQIVTYNEDESASTGKRHFNYCESVLRFTRINREQLYVQAASVDYDRQGTFESKVVLYGTISRAAPSAPSLPSFPSPLEGIPWQNLFTMPQ